ncbi:agmatinase [Zavarzinia sp. CC-PAN008]|uniref:agmatinase n=1 Tax=Zavarzinia sp. CC-PAN008 TaxID=3243332 RepID=UPI003F74454F
MDPAKLAALRQRFGVGADLAAEVEDPDFAKVVAQVFQGSTRRKPFEGVSTLLDAPYLPDAAGQADWGGIDIALVGVPMDLGVTNRPGARFGPRAIRTIERVGPFNHLLKRVPFSEGKIADVGDVPIQSRYGLDAAIADIFTYYTKLDDAGVRPLSAGGDHSISYPILKALGRKQPLALIHFDAHCDTAGGFEGAKFHHGGPFRNAVLDGVIDPEKTVQIGIRGASEYLWEFSYASGMTVLHIEDVVRMGPDAVIAKVRQVVGDTPAYVTFDVDGLDPIYAPGTGTPETGGLSMREAQAILRGLDGLDIVGGDVVEVAPQYDATTVTAQTGAQLMFEILCLMTGAPSFAKG